ncbi:MAG TPA: guanylate kinase [Candidatus Marinimicrobia bacterium]|nr:guanylate kinase [Candidatus Neomarinimicrobiota bacterium]
MKKGFLVFFAAHSGAGKTSIIRELLIRNPDWSFSVSATTRKPRNGEVHGKDYLFVDKETFKKMIANNKLLEYEEVHGEFYGTPSGPVYKALEDEKVMIFDLDVKGALILKKRFQNESVSIFVEVPDYNMLRKRLIDRGTETPEQVEKRLSRIPMETAMKHKFDNVVINHKLNDAVKETEKKINKAKEGK